MLVLEIYHKPPNFELAKGLSCKYCFTLSIEKLMNCHDTVMVESVHYAIHFYCFLNIDSAMQKWEAFIN